MMLSLEVESAMTREALLEQLRRLCTKEGSVTKWAMRHGIRPQYVHMALNGERAPGPQILAAMGLERVQPAESYRRRQAAE